MLDETVPSHLGSSFGTATNSLLAFGIMIAILLGVGLPEGKEDDPETIQARIDDEFWRVIYGFPWACQLLTLILLMTVYTVDSIGYSISIGADEDALKVIGMVYDKDENHNQILAELKQKTKKGGSSVTLAQACCDPQYRTATWIAFFNCFFQQ